MKKIATLIITVFLLSLTGVVGANSAMLKLFLNGRELETQVPPRIFDDHLFVPVESLAEGLGLTAEWDKENNSVRIEAAEREALNSQIQRLEEALAPTEPQTAAETWAEGVKTRNGAMQYAVMAPALKKESYDYFAAANWSTGTSSPWVESYRVTERYRIDGEKFRFTVEFDYTDSTQATYSTKAYVTVEQEQGKWLVSALDQIEAKGEIAKLTLDDDAEVKKIFVQGEKAGFGGYDQANVIISAETQIYNGYTDEELPVKALQKGALVEVVFTDDPRTMIYPVSAEAKTIRVIDPAQARTMVYENSKYGFTFTLPTGWQGYQVLVEEWEGISLEEGKNDKVVAKGPFLKLRHPKWTKEQPRQDIPIMVLTLDQWKDLQAVKFHIGAAPIGPKELGRNGKYVFALPARYNYAFPDGYEEVDAIIEGDALKPLKLKAD